jgi:hypothetical protein
VSRQILCSELLARSQQNTTAWGLIRRAREEEGWGLFQACPVCVVRALNSVRERYGRGEIYKEEVKDLNLTADLRCENFLSVLEQ